MDVTLEKAGQTRLAKVRNGALMRLAESLRQKDGKKRVSAGLVFALRFFKAEAASVAPAFSVAFLPSPIF